MDYDRLLEHFADDVGEKEEVALAILYLEEYDDLPAVSQSDVREVIQRSRSTISISSVSTYFGRLVDDGWLTSTGGRSYRLTREGEDGVKGLLDEGFLIEPREDRFIDTDIADDQFYQQLIKDVNECYRVRINDATLVLTRKLFENLLVDILRGHYGMSDVDLFFDRDRGYHLGLSALKRNLRDDVVDFRMYSRDIDEDLLDELDDFREHGDAGAHAIVVGLSDEEIEAMATKATRLTNVLYDVWRGVRAANN